MKLLTPLLFSLLSVTQMSMAAVHVSPLGNDQSNGTKKAPVKTAHRALEISIKKNDPNILFADGTYYFAEPLTLSHQYSGSKHAPRLFKAKNNGKVIFSAGQEAIVDWKPFKDGIYQAIIPSNIDLKQGCDGLFIAGQSPRLARFPNYNRQARWLKGVSAEAFSPARIKTWKNPKGGILHSMHPAHWGSNYWTITGKKSPSECTLEGGWMNNRGGGIHPTDRFVENIFEELDTEDEWFLDKDTRTLYFKPRGKFQTDKATIILSKQESCLRIEGADNQPVKHFQIEGISFRHTARTFMKTKEPLLRSDWRIYRGGAVFIEKAEYITIKDCEFTQLGGNAYFASGYNRNLALSGCHFHHIGAGAINFVGETNAVYNPIYKSYGKPIPFEKINKKNKGPKNPNYPSNCIAEDCLIHDIGLVEKQVAGLQISVAHKITGRHLSIYDVPRAGINISENAFGGHLIEFCDVFNTVQESADHGSFNSWGRDRYWRPNHSQVDKQVAQYPKLPIIDMLDRNIIRNSRWRCDHGWDIDLDDGSSGYIVENNLCLGGGIKLREGYYRIVRNNLAVSNSFHPHVWFKKSGDIIKHNIWATPLKPIRLTGKGKIWDKNIYLSKAGITEAHAYGVDPNGIHATLHYEDPSNLNYSFKQTPLISQTGFKPFSMNNFGVQKPSLKKIAKTPKPPLEKSTESSIIQPVYKLLGAKMKAVSTLGEVSATGLPDQNGILILKVTPDGLADKIHLQTLDVIREINGKKIRTWQDFIQSWKHAAPSKPVTASVWRSQRLIKLTLPVFTSATIIEQE